MSISRYIDKASCELEGGWFNLPGCQGSYVLNNCEIHTDTSVVFGNRVPKKFWKICEERGYGDLNPRVRLTTGEVVLPPYSSLSDLFKQLERHWPDITNETCGAHIHWSMLDEGYYSCLMENKFYHDWFKPRLFEFAQKEELDKKRCFADRLYNRTDRAQYYCKDVFQPLKQAYVTHKVYHNQSPDRYTFLNYCFSRFNTIECRLFTANIPLSKFFTCIEWLVETVNSYLDTHYESFSNTQLAQENVELEVNEGEINNNSNSNQVSSIDTSSFDIILEPGN